MIRSANEDDATAIARIYNHYILNTVVTFEETIVSVEEMSGRIAEITRASLPYLVAEQNDGIIGYAYATAWKGRSAYRFSVETTVYLDAGLVGKGHGTDLYQVLLAQLQERGLHVAMGGIALPNPGSVGLHESWGSKVAHFNEVGLKFDKWIDVGYWQRVF